MLSLDWLGGGAFQLGSPPGVWQAHAVHRFLEGIAAGTFGGARSTAGRVWQFERFGYAMGLKVSLDVQEFAELAGLIEATL
jgi:hypothetical protein